MVLSTFACDHEGLALILAAAIMVAGVMMIIVELISYAINKEKNQREEKNDRHLTD